MGKKKKFDIMTVIMVICLSLGTFVFFYPRVSNMIISYMAQKKQYEYEEKIKNISEDEKEMRLKKLEEENEELASRYMDLNDPFYLGAKEGTGRISGTKFGDIEPIGSIAIPKQNIFLSIYDGTDEDILKFGAGHMKKSSFPIGGINTHAVITAHTGFHTARLFTDLNKVEIGDKFYIKSISGILAYEVVEINTVLPDELQHLKIQRDRDLTTLMTCTPEGLNTHRLLVLGERIPYTPNIVKEYNKGIKESERETKNKNIIILIGIAASTALIVILFKKTKSGKNYV